MAVDRLLLVVAALLCWVSVSAAQQEMQVQKQVFAASGEFIQIDKVETNEANIAGVAEVHQIAFNSFPTLKLTLPKLELSTSSLLISGEEDVSFSTNDDINMEGGHEINFSASDIDLVAQTGDFKLDSQISEFVSGQGIDIDASDFQVNAGGGGVIFSSDGGDVLINSGGQFSSDAGGTLQVDGNVLASISSTTGNFDITAEGDGANFLAAANDRIVVDAITSMTLDAGTDIETRSGGGTQLSGDNIVITSDVIEVTSATDDVEFISHSPQAESTTTKITVTGSIAGNAERQGVFIQSRGNGDLVMDADNNVELISNGNANDGAGVNVAADTILLQATDQNPKTITVKGASVHLGGAPGDSLSVSATGLSLSHESLYVEGEWITTDVAAGDLLLELTGAQRYSKFTALSKSTSDEMMGTLNINAGLNAFATDIRIDGGGSVKFENTNQVQAEATRTGSITANGGDGSSVIKFKAAQDVKVDADGALDASGGIIYMQATGGNVDMLATNDISVVANNNLDGRVILESLQDTNIIGTTGFTQDSDTLRAWISRDFSASVTTAFLINSGGGFSLAGEDVTIGTGAFTGSATGGYDITAANCESDSECASLGRGTVTFKSTESSVAATTNGDLIARGEGNLSITSGSTLAFDGGSEFHLSADPSAFDSVNYDDGVDGLMSFTATTTDVTFTSDEVSWESLDKFSLSSTTTTGLIEGTQALKISSDNGQDFTLDSVQSKIFANADVTLNGAWVTMGSNTASFSATAGAALSVGSRSLGTHVSSAGNTALQASGVVTVDGFNGVHMHSDQNTEVNVGRTATMNGDDLVQVISEDGSVMYEAGTQFTVTSGGNIYGFSGEADNDTLKVDADGLVTYNAGLNLDVEVELGPLTINGNGGTTLVQSEQGNVLVTALNSVNLATVELDIEATNNDNVFSGGTVSIWATQEDVLVSSNGDISVTSRQVSLAGRDLQGADDTIVFGSGEDLAVLVEQGPITFIGNTFDITSNLNDTTTGNMELDATSDVIMATSASFDINIYGGGLVILAQTDDAETGHTWSAEGDIELYGAQAVSIQPNKGADGQVTMDSVSDMVISAKRDVVLVNDGQGIRFTANVGHSSGSDIVTHSRHDIFATAQTGDITMLSEGHTQARMAEDGDTFGRGIGGHDPLFHSDRFYEVGHNIRTTDPKGNIVVKTTDELTIGAGRTVFQYTDGLNSAIADDGITLNAEGEIFMESEDGFFTWRGQEGVTVDINEDAFFQASAHSYLWSEDQVIITAAQTVNMEAHGGHLTFETHSLGGNSDINLVTTAGPISQTAKGSGARLQSAEGTSITTNSNDIVVKGAAGVTFSTSNGPVSIHADDAGTITTTNKADFNAGRDFSMTGDTIALSAGERLSAIATGGAPNDDLLFTSTTTVSLESDTSIVIQSEGTETGANAKDRVLLSSAADLTLQAAGDLDIDAFNTINIGTDAVGAIVTMQGVGDTVTPGATWQSDGDITIKSDQAALIQSAQGSIDIYTSAAQTWSTSGPITMNAPDGIELDSNFGTTLFQTLGGNIKLVSGKNVDLKSKSLMAFTTLNSDITMTTTDDIAVTAPIISHRFAGDMTIRSEIATPADDGIVIEGDKSVKFESVAGSLGRIRFLADGTDPTGRTPQIAFVSDGPLDVTAIDGANPEDMTFKTNGATSPIAISTSELFSDIIFDFLDTITHTATGDTTLTTTDGPINIDSTQGTVNVKGLNLQMTTENAIGDISFIGQTATSFTSTTTMTMTVGKAFDAEAYSLLKLDSATTLTMTASDDITFQTAEGQQGDITFTFGAKWEVDHLAGDMNSVAGGSYKIQTTAAGATTIDFISAGTFKLADGREVAIQVLTTEDDAPLLMTAAGDVTWTAFKDVLISAGDEGNPHSLSVSSTNEALSLISTAADVNFLASSDSNTDSGDVVVSSAGTTALSHTITNDATFTAGQNIPVGAQVQDDTGYILLQAAGIADINAKTFTARSTEGKMRVHANDNIAVQAGTGLTVAAGRPDAAGNGITLETYNSAADITLQFANALSALADGDITFQSLGATGTFDINPSGPLTLRADGDEEAISDALIMRVTGSDSKLNVDIETSITFTNTNLNLEADDKLSLLSNGNQFDVKSATGLYFDAGGDPITTQADPAQDTILVKGTAITFQTFDECVTLCPNLANVGRITYNAHDELNMGLNSAPLLFSVPDADDAKFFIRMEAPEQITFDSNAAALNGIIVNNWETLDIHGREGVNLNNNEAGAGSIDVAITSTVAGLTINSGVRSDDGDISVISPVNNILVQSTTSTVQVTPENDFLGRASAAGFVAGTDLTVDLVKGSYSAEAFDNAGFAADTWIHATNQVTITAPRELRNREHDTLRFYTSGTSVQRQSTTFRLGLFLRGAGVSKDCRITQIEFDGSDFDTFNINCQNGGNTGGTNSDEQYCTGNRVTPLQAGTGDQNMLWNAGCPSASQRTEQMRQALLCYGLLDDVATNFGQVFDNLHPIPIGV